MTPGENATWIIVTDGPPSTVPAPNGRHVTLSPDATPAEALNLFDDVLARNLVGAEPSTSPEAAEIIDDPRHGRRRLLDEYRAEFAWEYLRSDGSVAIRTPAGSLGGRTEVLDPQGRLVMTGHGLGDLWRWWIDLITLGEDTVVVVSTSPRLSPELSRLGDRFVVVHSWASETIDEISTMTSRLSPDVTMLVRGLHRFDALVAPPEAIDSLRARFGHTDHWHAAGPDVSFWDEVVPAAIAGRKHHARLDGVRHRFEKKSIIVTVLGEGDLDTVRVRWESFAPDATSTIDRTLDVEREGRDFTLTADRSEVAPTDVQRLIVEWRDAVWISEITPPASIWRTLKRVFSWSAGPSMRELRDQRRALKDQAGDASVDSSSSSDGI